MKTFYTFTFAFKHDNKVLIGRRKSNRQNIFLYDDCNFPLKIREIDYYKKIIALYEHYTNDILEFVFINFPE